MLEYLCIIQARLGSTRLPGKVLITVGGTPMVKRVWQTAKAALVGRKAKVIVAWPERYPEVDENNVLERFRKISREFPSRRVIRLTADCPLLTTKDIWDAMSNSQYLCYYSNHYDGHDVQIFNTSILMTDTFTDKEHVIADFATKSTGLSVDTLESLQRVRNLAK